MNRAAVFDVGIIGGGPAGASLGCYLAKAGISCVILERELFPRPHVGESLVPSSTRVFRELDFLKEMEEARFPHKYGAVWTSNESGPAYDHSFHGIQADGHADIRFEEREQPGVDLDHTYHVDRGVFDLLLLQHAHTLGASVYEGIRVDGVDFVPEHPSIRFTMAGKPLSVNVRMVVDASGRHTLLGNQLKLKVNDPTFDQYAIHTWFGGYDRSVLAKSPAHHDYIYIHFLPISNSWVWQIPITDEITSIGVVTQKKNFLKARAEREKFFWECVASRPVFCETLRRTEQLRPFRDEGDYSYAMKQICGDRFMLIGDAARFVDPIFSTGVSIALNSARFAHRSIVGAVARNEFSPASFGEYSTTMRRGTQNWYDFISVYYRLNVLFTFFINDKRYRLDVLKLLQGDVYDEERPAVLGKMESMVADVERNRKHPWHGLLGTLTANAFRPAF